MQYEPPRSARGGSRNYFSKQKSIGRKSVNKKLTVFQGDDDEPLPEDEGSFRQDTNDTFNNLFLQ